MAEGFQSCEVKVAIGTFVIVGMRVGVIEGATVGVCEGLYFRIGFEVEEGVAAVDMMGAEGMQLTISKMPAMNEIMICFIPCSPEVSYSPAASTNLLNKPLVDS